MLLKRAAWSRPWIYITCFLTLVVGSKNGRKIGEISCLIWGKMHFSSLKFIDELSSVGSPSKNVSNFFKTRFETSSLSLERTTAHFCTALMIRMPTFCAIFIMFRAILALFWWPKNSGTRLRNGKKVSLAMQCVLLSQGQKKMAENHPSSSVFCRLQKMIMIKGLSSAWLVN